MTTEFSEDDIVQMSKVIYDLLCAKKTSKNVELEFRLGSIRPRAFDPTINRDIFLRAVDGLKTNPAWDAVEESHAVDYASKDGVRVTHDVARNAWSAMRKRKLCYHDAKGRSLDVRISMSTETPMTVPHPMPAPTMIREKRRTSFFHKFWRYDVTEVRTNPRESIDDDREATYEIEIELTDPSRIIGQPEAYVHYIVRYGLMLCQDVMKLAGV
jgi:hypothetical protein